jgi:hypothetical protein
VPYTWDDPSPLDGKGEESIDMRYMIHALHAAQNVVYGFGNTPHDYRDITYPQAIEQLRCMPQAGHLFPGAGERALGHHQYGRGSCRLA